jgi:hypothetical protein
MENKKATVLECPRALQVSGEAKMQEFVDLVTMKEAGALIMVMNSISSHLQLLKNEIDFYWEAQASGTTEEEPKGVHLQQLEHLNAGAHSLEEALSRRTIPGGNGIPQWTTPQPQEVQGEPEYQWEEVS